jgi:hypothetical protein
VTVGVAAAAGFGVLLGAATAAEAGLLEVTGVLLGDGIFAAGADGLLVEGMGLVAGAGLVVVPVGRGCKSAASLEDASTDPAAPARCA